MIKKIIITMSACFCALFFALTAQAYTVSYGSVNADALNVRPLPTTECTSMGLLPTNHQVIIVGQEGNWYKILHAGSYAYVCADYIVITQSNVEYYEPVPQITAPAPQTQTQTPAPQQTTTSVNSRNLYINPADIPSYAGSWVPGEYLVETAKQFIGTPYVYGGMSPSGFDCSGFVKYCYSLMGVNINRIACDQALNGVEVGTENMLPGDILCFASSAGGSYIGHTGIYVGNGYFIHSPHTGYSVEILPLDLTSYRQRIVNVRRIF